jgi:hypothetical protein
MEEKSTACFRTVHPTTDHPMTDRPQFLSVQLLSHEIEYPVAEHYSFNLPHLTTECRCRCDAGRRRPENCGKLCFEKSVFGVRCDASFGQIVCSSRVVPSNKFFRAFRVGTPRHVLTFKLHHFAGDPRQSSETLFRDRFYETTFRPKTFKT